MIGTWVRTKRFMKVKIAEVFETEAAAMVAGYTEPAYSEENFEVFGKVTATNRMSFAAIKV